MKTRNLFAVLIGLLVPPALMAQVDEPPPPPLESQPAEVTQMPQPEPPPVAVDPVPVASPSPAPQPVAIPSSTPASTPARAALAAPIPMPTPAPVNLQEPGQISQPKPAQPLPGKAGIRLNFQGAQLSDVLNYLSEAAGFVIVQEAPVTGTVNVISKQAISADEAVDLLNAVLLEKGYVAMRNGRILKIVNRSSAQRRSDLPVVQGSNPDLIPRKDDIVTQILPVRYVEAAKLVENLRPLLSENATITANENSNAILFTDTQANIRRIAEIIRALDTSISSISTIHVYGLRYADSKEIANVITQLFTTDQNSRNNQNAQQGVPPFFGGFGGFRGAGGGNRQNTPQSEARQAASRVIAVADTQSNSVIVSAPDEYMATISEVVSRLDTSISAVTETRIFRLQFADATELANIVNTLYAEDNTTTGNRNTAVVVGQGGQGNRIAAGQRQVQSGTSDRALLQARVVAVPDPRTNCVIISASRDMMEDVALTIGRLDASDSKKQHVYVHTLENADPEAVAAILRGMFTDQDSTSANQNTTSRLRQRQTSGASLDPNSVMNSSGGRGNAGGR